MVYATIIAILAYMLVFAVYFAAYWYRALEDIAMNADNILDITDDIQQNGVVTKHQINCLRIDSLAINKAMRNAEIHVRTQRKARTDDEERS